MGAHVEFDVDAVGQHRWRLVDGNNEIIASGEGYSTREAADKGFRNVRVEMANLLLKELVPVLRDIAVDLGFKI